MKFCEVRRVNGMLELLGIDGQVVARMNEGTRAVVELPEIRRNNPMGKRKRWKDGSLMTTQQATDEGYQAQMKIA